MTVTTLVPRRAVLVDSLDRAEIVAQMLGTPQWLADLIAQVMLQEKLPYEAAVHRALQRLGVDAYRTEAARARIATELQKGRKS